MAVKKARGAEDKRRCNATLLESRRRVWKLSRSIGWLVVRGLNREVSSGWRSESTSHAIRSRHQRAEPERILIASKIISAIHDSRKVMDIIKIAMNLPGSSRTEIFFSGPGSGTFILDAMVIKTMQLRA